MILNFIPKFKIRVYRGTVYIIKFNRLGCNVCQGEDVRGNLAVSNFRKMSLPTYEIQIKDYGYRKFNKKIHIMEQNL